MSEIYNGNFPLDFFESNKTEICIPGIHKDVWKINFPLLYPSIIEAYNICPSLDDTDMFYPPNSEDALKSENGEEHKEIDRTKYIIYEYINCKDSIKVVMDRRKGAYPSIIHNLNKIIRETCVGFIKNDIDVIYIFSKIKSNLKEERNNLFLKLSTRLQNLVKFLASLILAKVIDFIQSESGTVLSVTNDSIYFKNASHITEEILNKISNRSDEIFIKCEIEEIKKGVFITSNGITEISPSSYRDERIVSLFFDNKFFLNKNFQGSNHLLGEIVKTHLKFIEDNPTNDHKLKPDQLLKYFYDACINLFNIEDNNIFISIIRLNEDYKSDQFYFSIFLDNLKKEGIIIPKGSILEYQITLTPDEISTGIPAKLGHKMKLVDPSNNIDHAYYISKVSHIFDSFFDWNKSNSNPALIFSKYLTSNRIPPSYETFLFLIDNVKSRKFKELIISKGDEQTSEFESNEIVKLFRSNYQDEKSYKIASIKTNMITLFRLIPTFCNICKRTHEHTNPFLFIKDENNQKSLIINCRKNKSEFICYI